MNKGYTKSLEDEIDWKIIDQLHTATIKFSSTSLEIKKLYFVLIGIAVPTIIKLSANKLDISLFSTLYILTLTFWFLDSFTYYYQEKLREKMNLRFAEIKKRNKESLIVPSNIVVEYVIETNRTNRKRLWRSIFNSSIILYLVFLILNSLAMWLYLKEVI